MLAEPRDLARLLASYARDGLARVEAAGDAPSLAAVRGALEEALGVRFEGDRGAAFFRSTLVQTLFYGVFSAWVLWARQASPPYRPFQLAHGRLAPARAGAAGAVPTAFRSTPTTQPLGLVEVLDWTNAALDRVDQGAFFAKFNEGEAVPYFYEPFLQEFDPALRKQLGVWYTPVRGGALHGGAGGPGAAGRPGHRRRAGGGERLRARSLLRHRRLSGGSAAPHRRQPAGPGPGRADRVRTSSGRRWIGCSASRSCPRRSWSRTCKSG